MNNKIINILVIISIISLFITIISSVYGIYNAKYNAKLILTNNSIDTFDTKWVGGTFKCVKYLLSLPVEQKEKAYKGDAHSAPISLIEYLSSCVPEKSEHLNKIDRHLASFEVSSDIAYKAKETIRQSFNALDILVSRQSQINQCEMWGTIKSIMDHQETKTIIDEWRQYGNCGTDCFKAVSSLISNGIEQVLSKECGGQS